MYFAEEPITRRKATNENNMLRLGEEIVNNIPLEIMLKTWLTEIILFYFMGAPSLIQYRFDNAIHRRFKERSNISPK